MRKICCRVEQIPGPKSRLGAVTSQATRHPEFFFFLIHSLGLCLIQFLSLFSGAQGIFLLSSLLQIHNCCELLPPVSLPAVSVLKMCEFLDAGPCRSLVIFYTVLYFFQWLCGFLLEMLINVCLCGRRLLLFLKQKISIALCSPCQRKSQSGCLSIRKNLYPAIAWATARASMWQWPWARRLCYWQGGGDRLRGGSESSHHTFSENLVQIYFPASCIFL